SDDLNGGTKEEWAEVGQNYLAYTGPFYLDESGDVPLLQHHMSRSSFPNWLGNTQRRMVKIEKKGDDDFLTLGPEGETIVMGELRTTQLVWRRLPVNHAARPS
ncbi:Lipocalin-like domain-containing protein, partial [Coniochaeta sp. 2T2.1]